ncbi:uncharacterized protein LOC124326902 [Daphnia pulicaria]|uniref:uncharacterized protein LOC124326902 n=1 Tax=Daphnia pulicaria TaxID=35523 RepID=UPI001EEAE563|nr:uncharacterized protein LOC124326902 [Daphnia pulicaria]XP_046641584.1 uncharacterized protein LOC124326902 [Daphnia pulicaria]XP_046641590.1 uncharacterized protein LOC124326902 [Daphnia pulicaria]
MRSHVNDLSKKINTTENETKIMSGNLSTELKASLKATENKLRNELRATSSHLETSITTNLNTTRTELRNTANNVIADLTTKSRTGEIVDSIGRMPTSCSDLQRMGYKINGFFLVKGLKKMEIVFCDFYPDRNETQKWIGYADVKSAPVHFYVQRNFSFSTKNIPIPFELVRVNEGNAMNLTTGKFTASRTGIYFFSFTGAAFFPSFTQIGIGLYVNGIQIASGRIQKYVTGSQMAPLTIQSTLNLKTGDQVWVQNYHTSSSSSAVFLQDNSVEHLTHFTGFMLEEEIAASL